MDLSDDLSLSKVKVTACLPHRLSYLFTFVVNVHRGLKLIFFKGKRELFNSIEIEIVIVSNNRAVHCMGLGQVQVARTLLGISNFFNYSCNYI